MATITADQPISEDFSEYFDPSTTAVEIILHGAVEIGRSLKFAKLHSSRVLDAILVPKKEGTHALAITVNTNGPGL